MAHLSQSGFYRENHSARKARVVYLVPEHNAIASSRTVDLRTVSARLRPAVWPLPNSEAACAYFAGYSFFGICSLEGSYFQMYYHHDAAEIFSIVTD